jgi:hypothetical protein
MRTHSPNKVVAYVILATVILFFVVPFAYHKISAAIDYRYQEPAPVAIEWAQAKFVNIDGRVQVKRMNSAQWVEADYRTIIEKGDTVRIGPRGTARIVSADGTVYTAKPDTVITLLGIANGGSKDSSR